MTSHEEDRKLYIVTTMMTLEEYEVRRDREDAPLTLLTHHTKHTGDEFTEEHLPQILADIGDAAGIAPTELNDLERWTEDYDCSGWPAAMKIAVMEAAGRHWLPADANEVSKWIGDIRETAAFYDEFPELKDVFREKPDETARRWRERTA